MESLVESIQKNPGLYLVEGILLIILGTFAILMPITSTFGLGLILGIVLVIGGIYRFFRSLKTRKELKHFWLSLLSGLVATIVGFLFLANLVAGIFLLTVLLAAYFLVDGIALIFQSLASRPASYWGWLLFSGIITLILAVLIISGLPYTAIWIPGLLLGINLILTGFSLTYAAAGVEKIAQKYGT